MFLPKYS